MNIFILLLFSCPGSPRCEMYGSGRVHLKILDELGKPLPYKDADFFDVRNEGKNIAGGMKVLINEKDELIYEIALVEVRYNDCKRLKRGDSFTDEEIVRALDNAGTFSIKDVRTDSDGKPVPIYKTLVNIPYKDCYKSFERTSLKPTTYHSEPNHIYFCEVQLKKR